MKFINSKGKEVKKSIYQIRLKYPWRMVNLKTKSILFASNDIYEPNSITRPKLKLYESFDWQQKGNNLFDEKLGKWKLKNKKIYIDEITVNLFGDLRIKFSNNNVFETFTDTETDIEIWRLFECRNKENKIIVTGERFISDNYFK
ncbi:MAG: hypothetical protein LBT51_01750 [Fusobacteriaceae bacterium]|nr:hypothetical protein [Fusobacteriaceae bacterium]